MKTKNILLATLVVAMLVFVGCALTGNAGGTKCRVGTQQNCGTSNIGECKYGTQTCLKGSKWGTCTGNIEPTTEVCDNKDNDCNGVVDNGIAAQQCGSSNIGECKYGTQTCTSGAWGTCTGSVEPTTEVCDNKDNDCNGVVDNGIPIMCTTNASCGTDGYTGTATCGADNNVHQNWITWTCNNAGTCNSACTSSTLDKLKQTCTIGCLNGACKTGPADSCTKVGGYNFMVQGTATGYKAGSSYSDTDYCVDSAILKEYYCGGTTEYNYNYNCANATNTTACSGGACI